MLEVKPDFRESVVCFSEHLAFLKVISNCCKGFSVNFAEFSLKYVKVSL